MSLPFSKNGDNPRASIKTTIDKGFIAPSQIHTALQQKSHSAFLASCACALALLLAGCANSGARVGIGIPVGPVTIGVGAGTGGISVGAGVGAGPVGVGVGVNQSGQISGHAGVGASTSVGKGQVGVGVGGSTVLYDPSDPNHAKQPGSAPISAPPSNPIAPIQWRDAQGRVVPQCQVQGGC